MAVQDSAFQSKYITTNSYKINLYPLNKTDVHRGNFICLSWWLSGVANSEQFIDQRHQALKIFQRAGFILKPEKSQLVSSQKFTWLGINWCSQTWSLCLPAGKALTYTEAVTTLFSQRLESCCHLEHLLGKFISVGMCSDLAKLQEKLFANQFFLFKTESFQETYLKTLQNPRVGVLQEKSGLEGPRWTHCLFRHICCTKAGVTFLQKVM